MLRVVNLISFIFSLFVPVLTGNIVLAATQTVTTPTLLISEVKIRNDTTSLLDLDEFIEIYNASDQPVDLANYNFEYYNATNPIASQQPLQKPLFEYMLDVHAYLTLAKQPIQIANAQQSPFASLSDSGGRLRLVTSEGLVVDEVAWTNTQIMATATGIYPPILYQCNSSTILCNSNRILSLSRLLNTDGSFALTNPTWQLMSPSPNSSELLAYPEQTPLPDDTPPGPPPVDVPQLPFNTTTCEGIVISEILPNPSGADTGKEFIELYNPTDEEINLKGCSLQTSSSTKRYDLPDILVNPGTYTVFFGSVTPLTLPNSTSGTVWLLSPTDELSSIIYPGGMGEDASWSLIDGVWEVSYSVTPGALNVPMPIKPCPAGQTRNTDTNRCQAPVVVAVSTLAACKTGQERSLETNRCKSVTLSGTAITPCKEGQERNPATNRCRNIQADSSLSSCPEGQERNTDTNRCRKVTNSIGETLAAVTDVPTKTTSSHPKWWLAVLAVSLATGYAVFEWRRDISLHLANLKTRLGK